MRKTTSIQDRIAVRAYFTWLNGSTASAEGNWLEAEQIEQAYAERRAASAKKAAATRKARSPVTTVALASRPKRQAPSLRQ